MKNKNRKIIVIFDFCDTIFDGQSADCFLKYIAKKLTLCEMVSFFIKRKIVYNFIADSRLQKKYLLSSFKNMPRDMLLELANDFFNNIILKNIHSKVLEKLMWHIDSGHVIVVASGGFDIYLNFFVEYFRIDLLCCTKLKFNNDFFTGFIDGQECLGNNKVGFIKELIDLNEFDLSNSYCYSDHRSDLPIFNLVGNKIIVKNNQDISWIDNTFKILDVSKE